MITPPTPEQIAAAHPQSNTTPSEHDLELIAVNAALLRLFKGEYRDSGDRHSDSLFVREHVLMWHEQAGRLAALQTATKQPQGADSSICHICGEPRNMMGKGFCSYPHQMVPDKEVSPGMWSWKPVSQGEDWIYSATTEIAQYFVVSQAKVAEIIRKHAPLVANREDSERIGGHHLCEKGHGWVVNRQPCYLCQHARIEELTAKYNEQFLEIGRLKDAAMRPAQPERGQGRRT